MATIPPPFWGYNSVDEMYPSKRVLHWFPVEPHYHMLHSACGCYVARDGHVMRCVEGGAVFARFVHPTDADGHPDHAGMRALMTDGKSIVVCRRCWRKQRRYQNRLAADLLL